MLRDIDLIVVDFASLPVRCYTYVSTLRLCLTAAAERGIDVVVADRPVPLAHVTDGPVLDASCRSFVSQVDTPFCYGMTPGEIARWLVQTESLRVNLRVAPCRNYERESTPQPDWPPWTPPSPAILSWESALCYPATVLLEALPALDHGRATLLPFQVLGAPWTDGDRLADRLSNAGLQGVDVTPWPYEPGTGNRSVMFSGIRLHIRNPNRYSPTRTAVALLHALEQEYGRRRVWRNARVSFFDKLAGTPDLRGLLAGRCPLEAAQRSWKPGLARFRRSRSKALLYRS
jgi:uncharacterized protein YbbC (DUF1343 family)